MKKLLLLLQLVKFLAIFLPHLLHSRLQTVFCKVVTRDLNRFPDFYFRSPKSFSPICIFCSRLVSLQVARFLLGFQLSLGTQNALFFSVWVEHKEEYDCGPSKLYVDGYCLSHFSMTMTEHRDQSNSRDHNP